MKGKKEGLKSPFSLMSGVKFGVFFTVILFLAKLADHYFGDAGIYLTSLISGLFDVDVASWVHQVLNGPSPSLVGHIRRPLGPSRACSRLRSRRRRRDQHPVMEWHPVTDQPREQREQLRPEGPAGK